MTAARRLAIATRGFRGTFNVNNYINEALELDEPGVGVSIFDTISVENVEAIGVSVASVENVNISIEISDGTISVEPEYDDAVSVEQNC